jgi:hypothetical protein
MSRLRNEAAIEAKASPPKRTAAERARYSGYAIDPALNGAGVVEAWSRNTWGELEVAELSDHLAEAMKKDRRGTATEEDMLLAQAHALQAMFVSLARRAVGQQLLPHLETYTRLALKAQSQCRATLETLAALKNPPNLAFVGQANIGQAVQVNNGAAPPAPTLPRAGKPESARNELMGARHAQRLDTAATSTTGPAHPALAPVGAVHRTAHAGGQETVVAERGQGRPGDARPPAADAGAAPAAA